jgi:hypothetical protein
MVPARASSRATGTASSTSARGGAGELRVKYAILDGEIIYADESG